MTVRSMFPKEKISVTALTNSINSSARPTISVRSDQALGKLSQVRDEDQGRKASRWAALLASLGALTATVAAYAAFRKRENISSAEMFYGINRNLSYTESTPIVDRDEVIMFISDIVENKEITDRLLRLDYNIKFVQFADMLAESAEVSRGAARRKLIAALKSLLLVPQLHDGSIKVVEDCLQMLSVRPPYSIASRDEVKDRYTFRQLVRRTFVTEGVRAKLVEERPLGFLKRMARKWGG